MSKREVYDCDTCGKQNIARSKLVKHLLQFVSKENQQHLAEKLFPKAKVV